MAAARIMEELGSFEIRTEVASNPLPEHPDRPDTLAVSSPSPVRQPIRSTPRGSPKLREPNASLSPMCASTIHRKWARV